MHGITFNNLPPGRSADPVRMDVACFIGFAPFVKSPLFTDTLKHRLIDYGWDQTNIDQLAKTPGLIQNTPVPLESREAFSALFDDRRLDRAGRVSSMTLIDPVQIAKSDRVLYLIVDGQDIPIPLTPAVNGKLSLVKLEKQINDALNSFNSLAQAFIDPDTGHNLVIERADKVRKGELTVYKNNSLGFNESLQADSQYIQNYIAAAINAFFRHGGKKCYFICMGDPLPYEAGDFDKLKQLYLLFWGKERRDEYFKNIASFTRDNFLQISFPEIPEPVSPVTDWRGISHLAGLPDVTYVSFPDLIDLLGIPGEAGPKELVQEDKEIFVECSDSIEASLYYFTSAERAPMYDSESYSIWKRLILHILNYLRVNADTVQLVATLPLPEKRIQGDLRRFVFKELFTDKEEDENILRQLQLAFPWLKTKWSGDLPESLEPPEGILLGILAGQANRIGAFRSIAGSFAEGAYDLSPRDIDAYNKSEEGGSRLSDRISCFNFVPYGVVLQSDVTAVPEGNYRYGAVRRIMILIHRAGRRIGLDHVFEPGAEQTWRNIKNSFNDLLKNMYLKGGLRGKSPDDAYFVSCGRSSMTQNDIDNGRLIANVAFQPAVPIEQIAVDILLDHDGTVFIGNVYG